MIKPDLAKLETNLVYTFQDIALLKQAITHRSFEGCANNEKLEFLGDAVLNLVVAEELFNRYPELPEGKLTRLRAKLVCKNSLASVAQDLALAQFLRLGPGELKSGARARDSILEDALEAIIAAIYLDSGFAQCQKLILQWFAEKFAHLKADDDFLKDPKTLLQEYLQKRALGLPFYEVVAVKNLNKFDKQFTVECRVQDLNESARAEAPNIKRAEQKAARKILDKIEQGEK